MQCRAMRSISRSFIGWIALSVMLGVAMPLGAQATDAATAFETLYGERIRQAQALRDSAALVSLTREMVDAVERHGTRPDLQVMLCEKAYELALRLTGGTPVAGDAMRKLAALQPDRAREHRAKELDAYETAWRQASTADKRTTAMAYLSLTFRYADEQLDHRQWAEAEALYRRAVPVGGTIAADLRNSANRGVREARQGQQLERKLDTLHRRLNSRPDDADAARLLAIALATEMNDPAAAVIPSQISGDEFVIGMIGLMNRPVHELDGHDAYALGDWLLRQAPSPGTFDLVRREVLERAEAAYRAAARSSIEQERRIAAEDHSRRLRFELQAMQEARARGRELPRIRGTLSVMCNLWAQVYLNDQLLTNASITISSVPVELAPGDILKARLTNAAASKGFWLMFESQDGSQRFFTSRDTWRAYTPANADRWWEMTPRRDDPAVRVETHIDGYMMRVLGNHTRLFNRNQIIWGSDRNDLAYVYLVVH